MLSIAKAAAEKAAKEAAEQLAKEAAVKIAKEAAEKIAKEAAEKVAKEASEKVVKELADKIVKEAAEKATKEAAEKVAKEAAEKAAKEAAEKAAKIGTGAVAEKAAKEAAEKVAKETAEKALTLTQKLKRGVIAAGGLAVIGLVGLEGDRVLKKSQESFDKRNEKQFEVSKIASTTTEMTITFSNPDNLKIYAEETVELINVFPQIIDKYAVINQVDNTNVTVVFSKPVYNNSDIKGGMMKLYADQRNDVNDVIKEDLKKAAEVVGGALGSALCTTISTFGLTPYVGYAVNGAYVVFFIIILMILMKILQLVSLVLGDHVAVKIVSGLMTLAILYTTHVYASPYFVLNC